MIVRLRSLFVSAVILSLLLLSSCERDPQRAKAKYFATGQDYMKKGQYGDAALEFQNALRLDPRFVDAYYQLAQADVAQRDWSAAYASLEKAVELDPTRLDARLDLGRLHFAARDFTEAEKDARTVLAQEPNNVAAHQILGAALIGQQKSADALQEFSKVTELRPNDASAYVNLALVEISFHRAVPAEQHLKKAVSVDPKSIQAYEDLAQFYRLQNRQPEAEQVLHDAIAKNPDGIALYIDWASMLSGEGRNDQAEALLDQLRKQLPNSADASTAIGNFYFARKETDRALSEYHRGLSFSPKSLELQKQIQDLYLATNQTQLATSLDAQLMNDFPTDVAVRVDHGRLLIAQGKAGDAIIFLEKVVKDAADSAQADYYLAIAHWQHGDIAQAQSSLRDALKVSPGMPVALQALARLSLAQANPHDAQLYAQELVQKFPADSADRQLFALALAQQKHFRQAEEQLLIAKQLTPSDPAIHLNLAQVYSAQQEWSVAQKEFQLCLQLDPHNSTSLGQYADFLVARNQSAQALARVQQYVAANSSDANAHLILGALHFDSRDYSAAHSEFERAIQIDPQNTQAYLRLGKLYEVQGHTNEAIAHYQNALDLQPKLAPLATMIGDLYLDNGDLEAARKYYRRALDADPDYAIANANMAWVDAKEGKNLDVALAMAQRAKSRMPELPSISDTLAWVMYKRHNYDAAVPLLRESVQKSPDSAEFRYHLGMTLLALGQKTEAKQQLQTALRLKLNGSDMQQAQNVLAKVSE